jgi:hypothetical protein
MVSFVKFDLLSNQQETSFNGGSSETYTQSVSKQKTFDSAIATVNDLTTLTTPQHIKSYDLDFLEWFVGFSEGDGSFVR